MENISNDKLVTLDKYECIKLDEWTTEEGIYLLGRCLEDKTFYYVSINREVFEYDHMPTRSEIESDYITVISMRELDRWEAEEYGRIYGNADVEAIAHEIEIEMQAEQLFRSIMEEMANETMSVESLCEKNHWILLVIENAMLNGVPEATVREILSFDEKGEFMYSEEIMTSAFEYFVEIAESDGIEGECGAFVEQAMKRRAEQLFQTVMTGMAEATLREMDSVPDDWHSPRGYEREATSADWEHMRDYGHTWGPGCEEPKPTREETLAGFAASNANKHKELLPFVEKALLNNVPESRVRDILSLDFCGDFELTTDEIKERIEKSIVRAGNEKKWTPVEDETITLRDNNGVWLYLDEKYQDQYVDENGTKFDMYFGTVGCEKQLILKEEGKEKYYTSTAFSNKYTGMEVELTDMDDYSWRMTTQNPQKVTKQCMQLVREHTLETLEKEIADRGKEGLEEEFHTWSNPKLYRFSTLTLQDAVTLIRKESELFKSTTEILALPLHDKSDKIKVDGHVGKWYVIESEVIEGKKLFLLEHETYGDEAACLIVDEYRNVMLDDVWNGFDDYTEHLACCENEFITKCQAAFLEAGYTYDEINSHDGYLYFISEYGRQMTFETWKEAAEWLDGVVFDDPEVSDAVESIMHPERFKKKQTR